MVLLNLLVVEIALLVHSPKKQAHHAQTEHEPDHCQVAIHKDYDEYLPQVAILIPRCRKDLLVEERVAVNEPDAFKGVQY